MLSTTHLSRPAGDGLPGAVVVLDLGGADLGGARG
jgi:hypothetical protein